MERVSILGMGNVLMGDDGAGPYAAAVLAAGYVLPENVTVQDIGTPGLDLAPFMADADTLMLLDTVLSDAPAGSIRTYDKATLSQCKLQLRLSPHDPALGQCLTTLEMAGCAPRDLLLVGIVPERTQLGTGLSESVQNAIPVAVARVVAELHTRGIHLEELETPGQPDIWWEQ
jgi:hydrogenase maturation protease